MVRGYAAAWAGNVSRTSYHVVGCDMPTHIQQETMSEYIHLEFGERGVPVLIEEEATEISKHTGRELRVIKGRTVARGQDMHNWFTDALQEYGNGAWSHPHSAFGRLKWSLSRGSYSITNGDQYSYDMTLREREEFEIEALVVDGTELEVIRYQENSADSLLFIRALVWLDEENRKRIRDLIETASYFPVVRRGINEAPIDMRFGMCAWSRHDGRFKYSLYFVDKEYDAGRRRNHIVDIEKNNRNRTIAFELAFLHELTSHLINKGLLTEDEREQMNVRANESVDRVRHGFTEVDDAAIIDFEE